MWSIFRPFRCNISPAYWNLCRSEIRIIRVEMVINYNRSMHFDTIRFRCHLSAEKTIDLECNFTKCRCSLMQQIHTQTLTDSHAHTLRYSHFCLIFSSHFILCEFFFPVTILFRCILSFWQTDTVPRGSFIFSCFYCICSECRVHKTPRIMWKCAVHCLIPKSACRTWLHCNEASHDYWSVKWNTQCD